MTFWGWTDPDNEKLFLEVQVAHRNVLIPGAREEALAFKSKELKERPELFPVIKGITQRSLKFLEDTEARLNASLSQYLECADISGDDPFTSRRRQSEQARRRELATMHGLPV